MSILRQLLIAAALAALPGIELATVSATVIVTGAATTPNSLWVPPRRSIVDLQAKGGPQWDLYIQALRAMHEANSTDAESFFQISGIHGKPFVEYDNTGPKITNGWAGYCPHSEALFLAWHRAFVVLFEQTLVAHAKRIAQGYPEAHRAKYVEAASTLRSPFWDWAKDAAVPQATVPQTMSINVPAGGGLQVKQVDNPLQTFKFPPGVLDGKFGPFDVERRTQMLRCSTSNVSYPATPNQKIKSSNYNNMVHGLFTKSTTFAQFATMQSSGSSIEAIHDGIHWDAACQGQFLTVEFSGFEPLFMLHHSNVDRLWTYWEMLHPTEKSFQGSYPGKDRWASRKDTMITQDSLLMPFRRSIDSYHTPRSVESIHTLGYSYPGLENRAATAEANKLQVTRFINEMAAPNGPPQVVKSSAPRPRELGQRARTRYFAHISVELSEAQRPCSIDIWIKEVFAGNLVLLSMPEYGLVHGEVPLEVDDMHVNLEDDKEERMVRLLESWLHVEILKADGSNVALETIPSLGMEIERVRMTEPSSDSELPQYTGSIKYGIDIRKR